MNITVTFNGVITFSDVNLNDGVRDVHYSHISQGQIQDFLIWCARNIFAHLYLIRAFAVRLCFDDRRLLLKTNIVLGPVVQSIVSLTSSLRVISLTVLADSIYNILIFFAEKM